MSKQQVEFVIRRILHANRFRDHKSGLLIGSMDDKDIERFRSIAPQCQYKRITAGHIINFEKPDIFIQEVDIFASSIKF